MFGLGVILVALARSADAVAFRFAVILVALGLLFMVTALVLWAAGMLAHPRRAAVFALAKHEARSKRIAQAELRELRGREEASKGSPPLGFSTRG